MPLSGIEALIAVSQMKVDNANNAALDGASKQTDLVKKQDLEKNSQTSSTQNAKSAERGPTPASAGNKKSVATPAERYFNNAVEYWHRMHRGYINSGF